MNFKFNLNLLSQYRTPLMGLAALMIVVCHAPSYGVEMPEAIAGLLGRGGLGVDIFLFLSGLGCWYSLSKGPSLGSWYSKRFMRIFVPYLLMQIPFWLWRLLDGTFSLPHELLVFSTIGFWLYHVGAWYVALLVPLYLLTPPLFRLLQNKYRGLIAILLVVVLVIVCMLPIEQLSGVTHEVLSNLQWSFGRVPSFIIGMALAPLVKNDVKFNAVLLIVLPLVVYVLIHEFIDKDTPSQWCLVLPVMIVLTFFLKWMKETGFVYRFISWMGIVSLESYLANIYLCQTIKDTLSALRDKFQLLYGGYSEYVIVILLGMLFALIVNRASRLLLVGFEHRVEAK